MKATLAFLAACILAISAAAVNAQSAAPNASGTAAATAPDAYPGEMQRATWTIGYGANFSQIAANVTTPRWFVVHEYGNGPGDAVELYVDTVGSNNPVNYGGGALVYGKSVYVKAYNGTGSFSGAWATIDPARVTQVSIPWSIYPETNKEAVLGMFDSVREFVVSFSRDGKLQDCTAGALKLIVDGNTLTDPSGKPLVIAQGSAVIARGQKVRVTVSGTCNAGTGYMGLVQLL